MFEIKNFDTWHEYDGFSEGSGRSEKVWLISDDKTVGLFKFPKIDPVVNGPTTEHISEHLAHQLGKILGVSTARVDIGTRDGRIGCMSYLVCDSGENLAEGINFISGVFPEYNADTMYDEKNKLYYCMNHIFDSVPSVVPQKVWVEMMLFDYLIGNADRHQSNWALLLKLSVQKKITVQLSQCPLYDNGSSLCCYVTEPQIAKYEAKDGRAFESLVDTKSRSLIRIDGTQKKTPRHKEVVEHLLKTYPVSKVIAQNFVKQLTCETIEDLLAQYPDEMLSTRKKTLIIRYLCRKIEMLQELLEGVGNSDAQ